ncbi:centromere protein U [Girardinichthys multiradiatus]|uniref:centromere protein U n=1 Tax=Girardinichthys multiradiatus TaxID=208333 RepID=UPI001FAC9016|nr:centromere protein U [Girardinichthys multiradiatus]
MRKSRGSKAPSDPVEKNLMDSHLSDIDQASFFHGLQQNNSNPLHSTALEVNVDVQEERQLGQKPGQRDENLAGQKQGAAVKRKEPGGGREKRKRSRANTGGKAQNRPAQRRQLEKDHRAAESAAEKTAESEGQSDSEGARKNRRSLRSSDEESNEGSIWKPSPKDPRRRRFSRKSSSEAPKGAGSERQKKRRHVGRGGSQLEVVLETLLDFCQEYGESVESAAVRVFIGSFSKNAKAQLMEKISSLKELKSIKGENTKVGSLIQTKTRTLLNAKQELMRAERQRWLLEKEKAELHQRLGDLRRGKAFLHDIRELTTHYLAHRRKHPTEKETFGASSLPALLLETKLIRRPRVPPREVGKPLKRAKK